jgi:hypothetical protein
MKDTSVGFLIQLQCLFRGLDPANLLFVVWGLVSTAPGVLAESIYMIHPS